MLELARERLELDPVNFRATPESLLLNPLIAVEHNTNDLKTGYVIETN
jgi:hypothetical protein